MNLPDQQGPAHNPYLKVDRPDQQEEVPSPYSKREIWHPDKIREALEVPDLTETGSPHAVNAIKDDIVNALQQNGFGNIQIVRGPAVVSVEDNFDTLRFPADNAGRSSVYTRYVDENHVLRTHTSAAVPPTLRAIADQRIDLDGMKTLVMPGIVYRRDVTDREHIGIFHQMDVWVIKRNGSEGAFQKSDLLQLAHTVFDAANPGKDLILYDAEHPYTLQGIEAYSEFGDQELEIFEAGLAHPEVLERCGLDPSEYSGLALGMGLDRLVMARKNIPDIRLLRANNPKVAQQMNDLNPYRGISNQPAISRDMSYVVPADATPEDICDGLQEAFGVNAYLVEDVALQSITPPEDLPPNVRERLGMRSGMVNVLVRVALRHPDKTLTKKEANRLYNEAYALAHQGSVTGYGGVPA